MAVWKGIAADDQARRELIRAHNLAQADRHLGEAIVQCDFSRAVTLVKASGANPNLETSTGFTALARAAFYGNVSAVRDLIAVGADPDKENVRQWRERVTHPVLDTLVFSKA